MEWHASIAYVKELIGFGFPDRSELSQRRPRESHHLQLQSVWPEQRLASGVAVLRLSPVLDNAMSSAVATAPLSGGGSFRLRELMRVVRALRLGDPSIHGIRYALPFHKSTPHMIIASGIVTPTTSVRTERLAVQP